MPVENATPVDVLEAYDPLNQENVIVRDYTHSNVNADPNEIIEEPVFRAPDLEEPISETKSGPTEQPSFNPTYSELPNKEKKEGAELMASAIIDGYSTIIGLAGKIATISESKLDTEIMEGNIDPTISFPINERGDVAGVKEFVKEYNSEAQEAFSVSEEFKQTVTPPLVRVLQKKGAAMTDEHFLMYHFGKDIVEKGIIAFTLSKQNKSILENLREQTLELKRNRQGSYEYKPENNPSPQEPNIIPVKEEKEAKNEKVEQPKPPRNTRNKKAQTPVIITEEQTFSTETLPNPGFKSVIETPPGMPEFGDANLLKHMEEASKRGENNSGANKQNKRDQKKK